MVAWACSATKCNIFYLPHESNQIEANKMLMQNVCFSWPLESCQRIWFTILALICTHVSIRYNISTPNPNLQTSHASLFFTIYCAHCMFFCFFCPTCLRELLRHTSARSHKCRQPSHHLPGTPQPAQKLPHTQQVAQQPGEGCSGRHKQRGRLLPVRQVLLC